jgi:hypothetical protein
MGSKLALEIPTIQKNKIKTRIIISFSKKIAQHWFGPIIIIMLSGVDVH